MTIKAVLRNGQIQPTQPLPSEWTEGQELVIEEPGLNDIADHNDKWVKDLEASASSIPEEEHERFRRALDANERESKETIRREWELP